jgi:hypothetical protein
VEAPLANVGAINPLKRQFACQLLIREKLPRQDEDSEHVKFQTRRARGQQSFDIFRHFSLTIP